MTMTEMLDIIEENDDDTPLIKQLRQQLREKSNDSKRVAELESKIAEYEQKDAVRTAGLDKLNERQMKALIAAHDGEFNSDALKATAIELGFAEPDPADQERENEMAAQQRIATATTGAKPPAAAGTITPADAADWSAEKWMRFAKQNPEHAEALRRGQEITGVSF